MRKIFALLVLAVSIHSLYAQTIIQMVEDKGVYKMGLHRNDVIPASCMASRRNPKYRSSVKP